MTDWVKLLHMLRVAITWTGIIATHIAVHVDTGLCQ